MNSRGLLLLMLFAPKKADQKKLARLLHKEMVTHEPFTLSELQEEVEWDIGYKLDKRNFQRKILGLGVLRHVGNRHGVSYRPPRLYAWQLHDK